MHPSGRLLRRMATGAVMARTALLRCSSTVGIPGSSSPSSTFSVGSWPSDDAAERAKEAFRTLFPDSNSATPLAALQEMQHEEATNTAHEEKEVSHGEEEMEQEACHAADEELHHEVEESMSPPDATFATDEKPKKAKKPRKRSSRKSAVAVVEEAVPPAEAEAEEGTAAPAPIAAAEEEPMVPRHPMNLQGGEYQGEIAAKLMKAAEAHGFTSPFWSTKAAFAATGAEMKVADDEGVLVETSTAQLRLYNLQQTNLSVSMAMAGVTEMRQQRYRRRDEMLAAITPCDVTGRRLPITRAEAIADSENYTALQRLSPIWVSWREIREMNLHVKPEEKNNFVAIPYFLPLGEVQRKALAAHGSAALPVGEWTPGNVAEADDALTARDELGVDVTTHHVYYNASQLFDGARLQAFATDKCARCFTMLGNRYNASTTFLMWEYCRRYHFPLYSPKRIVFATAERVHSMGGTLRTDLVRLPLTNPAEYPLGAGEDKKDVPLAESGGVVPPPFTLIIHNEIVSLYNVEQTNIPDVLHRVSEEKTQARFAGYRERIAEGRGSQILRQGTGGRSVLRHPGEKLPAPSESHAD